jgi:hypothetical protein
MKRLCGLVAILLMQPTYAHVPQPRVRLPQYQQNCNLPEQLVVEQYIIMSAKAIDEAELGPAFKIKDVPFNIDDKEEITTLSFYGGCKMPTAAVFRRANGEPISIMIMKDSPAYGRLKNYMENKVSTKEVLRGTKAQPVKP